MKYFYSLFKPFLTFSFLAVSAIGIAQSPTTGSPSNDCVIVQNFNDSSNFSSPSIYTEFPGYQFSWTHSNGNGYLQGSQPGFNGEYYLSLISPAYTNNSPEGSFIVGFFYMVPAGTLYRIRVIQPDPLDYKAVYPEGPAIGGGQPNWNVFPNTAGTICLQLFDADLHTGQALRVEFTFYVPNNPPGAQPVIFDNFALTSAAPAPLPLPVTFMGMVATREKNNVTVKWDVATELHVKQYDVEKSTDGRTFSVVGNVPAAEKQVYSFTEANVGSGILFYRVKSVDFDGSVKYSGIVKLVAASSYSNSIRVYPSPAQSQVTLAHNRLSANAKITLSTMDGRIIKAVVPSFGASNTMIDISNLSSGMYILRLDDGTGKIETTTFVKQ